MQTYDYRGAQDKIAEHHSALMQATSADGDDKYLNQDAAIKHITGVGIEPSKLLLGLPAFGKKFRLTSDLHDLGSPATCVGSVPYTELCRNMMSGWQRVFLDDRQVPIMIKGDEVIGYDDLQSLELKVRAHLLTDSSCYRLVQRSITPRNNVSVESSFIRSTSTIVQVNRATKANFRWSPWSNV